MRTLVALLMLALVAAFLWWGLSRGDSKPVVDDETMGAMPAETPSHPLAKSPTRPGGLEGGAPRAPIPTSKPAPGETVISYGSLRVRFAPAAGLTIGTSRLDLEPVGAALFHYPLAAEQEDGTWLYERLPVGKYRVRAFVPGAQDAVVEATIGKDAETSSTIPLVAGIEVAYRVALHSGDVPSLVLVELLDGRGVRMGGSFHTGAGVAYLSSTASRKLPSEGRVVGLRPGTYRLRAVSEAGETDEQPFEASAATPTVELKLRK